MVTHNPENERIKRRYLTYLKEANRYSEPTVDSVAKALIRFETDTKYRDFKKFNADQATAFKRHFAEQKRHDSEEKLSKSTLNATLTYLKKFFHWLAGQPGYKSRLQYSDADYFNLSEKEVRIATARRELAGPTSEQVKHVLGRMPADTPIERRNRALIAFTLLTGARDGAVESMKLKHIDLAAGSVFQDAREVRTKNSKTFTTYFFPVGNEIRQIVTEWIAFLQEELLWGGDDPLFPATEVKLGSTGQFEVVGLKRTHWSNAGQIRTIFREAFNHAGLPYFNPHSFRKTLAVLGEVKCKTPEEFKAWSQNLGHEQVLTTFLSYGEVANHRQGEIIRDLGTPQCGMPLDVGELAEALWRRMRDSGLDTRACSVLGFPPEDPR